MGLWDTVTRITRRVLTGTPSSVTPDVHSAWLNEQIKAYATLQPYAAPLSSQDNFTGETLEMRAAYRRLLKEPAVYAPLMSRTLDVCRLDPIVQPEDKADPVQKDAAAWANWSITRSRGGWPQLLQNMLLPGQMDGFSVVEKVWGTVPRHHPKYAGRWTLDAAKGKDTQYIRFRLDTYKNVVAVQAMNAGQGGQPLDPADFVLFTHLKIFENPFGMSALRPAYRAANLIEAAIKLRSILLENFSGPFLVFKYGQQARKDEAQRALAAARSRGYIVIDPTDNLEVINLATSAPDQFQATIEDLRKELFLAIRGAYLQALESKTSQGDAATHQSEADIFVWYLAQAAAQAITEQLIPDLIEPHYGPRGGRATVKLGGIDPGSIKGRLEVFERVSKLVRVSAEQIYEVCGVEPPRDETDAVGGEQPDPMGGDFGPGGDDPDGLSGGDFGDDDPPSGGGGDREATVLAILMAASEGDAESVRALAAGEGQAEDDPEPVQFADRSKLVRKKITDKNGHQRIVYVRPGDEPEKPQRGARKPTQVQNTEQHADSETAVAAAVNDPNGMSDEHLAALPDHLLSLNKTRLAELAKQMGERVGGKKAELAQRLLDSVRAGRDSQQAPGRALERQQTKTSGQYGAWGQAVGGTGGKPEAKRADFGPVAPAPSQPASNLARQTVAPATRATGNVKKKPVDQLTDAEFRSEFQRLMNEDKSLSAGDIRRWDELNRRFRQKVLSQSPADRPESAGAGVSAATGDRSQ